MSVNADNVCQRPPELAFVSHYIKLNSQDLLMVRMWRQDNHRRGPFVPGEEGGDGKVAHSSRGRVTARGGQTEEGQGLFPSLTGPSLRPEGSFKSSGSSRDNMAADAYSTYLRGERPPPLIQINSSKTFSARLSPRKKLGVFTALPPAGQ